MTVRRGAVKPILTKEEYDLLHANDGVGQMPDLISRVATMLMYGMDTHEIHYRLEAEGIPSYDIFLTFKAAQIIHRERMVDQLTF